MEVRAGETANWLQLRRPIATNPDLRNKIPQSNARPIKPSHRVARQTPLPALTRKQPKPRVIPSALSANTSSNTVEIGLQIQPPIAKAPDRRPFANLKQIETEPGPHPSPNSECFSWQPNCEAAPPKPGASPTRSLVRTAIEPTTLSNI
jgi:hypothetical protein